MAAPGDPREQVGGERRAAHPVAHLLGQARAIEVRDGIAGHGPGRKPSHAFDHAGREGACEGDPALRLAGGGVVVDGPHGEQGRAARALHDATHAVADRTELARGDALLDGGQQIRIRRDLVFLCRRIDGVGGTYFQVAVEHQQRVDVEAHQRPGVQRIGEVVGPVAARELGGFGPDGVVPERRMQVSKLGLEAAFQLAALHVDVARLDVGDVDQPAAL